MNRRAGVLFTPGPVTLDAAVQAAGGEPMVYHRTPEFSGTIANCDRLLRSAAEAGANARTVILTASGTGAMEATVLNLLDPGQIAWVVNGGDFGARFAAICRCNGLPTREIFVERGRSLDAAALAKIDAAGAQALLLTHHETSTGALHDVDAAARFCRGHGLLLVVDAVGSFLADPLAMAASGIDALIFSSQKALALPPGLSFVILSERAIKRIRSLPRRSYYFDFARSLNDLERGQTPFTPPVGLIRQLEIRLEQIAVAGAERCVAQVAELARDFRRGIGDLPYAQFAERPSNAVTALQPLDGRTPAEHVAALHERGYVVCPNGGELAGQIFRVGHLGSLSSALHRGLLAAMRDALPSSVLASTDPK